MNVRKKMFWGGLGWVLGGPIGAIIGYSLAGMNPQYSTSNNFFDSRAYPKTQPGDFMVSLLVLFGAVMKADNRMLKSELDFVKQFLSKQFSNQEVRDFMTLFKDITKQSYPLKDVCRQITRSMDHPSRLELIHILYGLSLADGDIHPDEEKLIHTISNYLNINQNDYSSIKAMFIKDFKSDYKILEISSKITPSKVSKYSIKIAKDGVSRNAVEILSQKDVDMKKIREIWPEIPIFTKEIDEQIKINAHYRGYLKKQKADILAFKRDENLIIPNKINYDSLSGLSNEVKAKFNQIKPRTMGQALRIDGITPAAVYILLSHVKRKSIKHIA